MSPEFTTNIYSFTIFFQKLIKFYVGFLFNIIYMFYVAIFQNFMNVSLVVLTIHFDFMYNVFLIRDFFFFFFEK